MADIRYRISEVDYGEEERQAILEVLDSKWVSIGPKTAEFERQFADFLEADHAVAVANGTAALHLAMLACGLGPGDEVLVPSFTFVASVNAITYVGATPRFVDITGPHDLNLDPADVERKITSRTKAILVVHLAGFIADMDRIRQIANQHGLKIVEDACHAVGARYQGDPAGSLQGKMAGTLSDVGCFSFFANKNLATGEGGMIVTRDAKIAENVRLMRSHGMTKTSWDKASGRAVDYDVVQVGYNYRCTELTSALGLVQLKKLPAGNERRRQLVARYRQRLASCATLTIPFADRLDDSSHHIFPILLNDAAQRPAFRQALLDRGIQTTFHYPPAHLFTHYRQLVPNAPSLDLTLDAASREVTLPLHPLLTESDIDIISGAVLSVGKV
jgi:dTDP-4-amino-4,6-dideoxygalactose transaminase